MSSLGLIWRHVIINTLGTWLHGDQRGFRSRGHRIHSSGDYRHPPPPEEHANLRRFQKSRSAGPVRIPRQVRCRMGRALLEFCRKGKCRVLAISVSDEHAHLLMELPADRKLAMLVVGRCKGGASHALRDVMPGQIWGRDGTLEPIGDRQHQINTFYYIVEKQGPKAWTWNYQTGEHDAVEE